MNCFPDVWNRFHKFDVRSKNPDGSLKLKDTVAMKSKEQGLDGNIEPLFPGMMPLKFGFIMCKTLEPSIIMELLVTLYGHNGIVDHFRKKSEPILVALNPIDDGLVEFCPLMILRSPRLNRSGSL